MTDDDIQPPADWLTPPAADPLAAVTRQFRAISTLKESQRNVFTLRGQPFAKLIAASGATPARAELAKLSGSGTEAFALATAADQRRFLDEAKRRAGKLGDD